MDLQVELDHLPIPGVDLLHALRRDKLDASCSASLKGGAKVDILLFPPKKCRPVNAETIGNLLVCHA
jgi:hypothetical protein